MPPIKLYDTKLKRAKRMGQHSAGIFEKSRQHRSNSYNMRIPTPQANLDARQRQGHFKIGLGRESPPRLALCRGAQILILINRTAQHKFLKTSRTTCGLWDAF